MTNTNIITARPAPISAAVAQLLTVEIPFSGFYETCISAELDSAVESAIEWENEQNGTSLTSEDYEINWRAMHLDTARAIADFYPEYIRMNTGVEITALYGSMKSPREYNFYNDSITCSIPLHDLKKLLNWLEENHPGLLADYVKQRFTPVSGWIPFYNPDIKTWGHEDSWDEAQWGVVLEAVEKGINGDAPDYYMTLEGEYWYQAGGEFDAWQYMTRRENEEA